MEEEGSSPYNFTDTISHSRFSTLTECIQLYPKGQTDDTVGQSKIIRFVLPNNRFLAVYFSNSDGLQATVSLLQKKPNEDEWSACTEASASNLAINALSIYCAFHEIYLARNDIRVVDFESGYKQAQRLMFNPIYAHIGQKLQGKIIFEENDPLAYIAMLKSDFKMGSNLMKELFKTSFTSTAGDGQFTFRLQPFSFPFFQRSVDRTQNKAFILSEDPSSSNELSIVCNLRHSDSNALFSYRKSPNDNTQYKFEVKQLSLLLRVVVFTPAIRNTLISQPIVKYPRIRHEIFQKSVPDSSQIISVDMPNVQIPSHIVIFAVKKKLLNESRTLEALTDANRYDTFIPLKPTSINVKYNEYSLFRQDMSPWRFYSKQNKLYLYENFLKGIGITCDELTNEKMNFATFIDPEKLSFPVISLNLSADLISGVPSLPLGMSEESLKSNQNLSYTMQIENYEVTDDLTIITVLSYNTILHYNVIQHHVEREEIVY